MQFWSKLRHLETHNLFFLPLGILGIIFSSLALAETANSGTTLSTATTSMQQPANYCPLASDLIKDGLFWYSKDGNWKCYTQSFANEIKAFTGAQWEGVNVGKVFCFYIGTEQFAFPIALEQVHSSIILEPKINTWSAKIGGGFKVCKSANVVDCPFFYQPAPDYSHIYQEIEYTGGRQDNE